MLYIGASNLTEQKALFGPVLKLLKPHKIVLTADREFYSIFLSNCLKKDQKKRCIFCFDTKKLTMIKLTMIKRGIKYPLLSKLKFKFGETKLLLNQISSDLEVNSSFSKVNNEVNYE